MLTDIRRVMQEQRENFNEEIENIKQYQKEIVEMKNITKLKISLEAFNSRLDQVEERIPRQWSSSNQMSK